jgi:hypothetical protein
MPFIGNTGKLDQIYLQRLDPQNVENQVRNIENLFTGDVEASNLFSSNLVLRNDTIFNPTHNFELGSNLWMDDYRDDGLTMRVFKDTRMDRLFVDQAIGIDNLNPTHDLDIGDKFFVDLNPAATNLVVARGRVQADSIVSTGFSTAKGRHRRRRGGRAHGEWEPFGAKSHGHRRSVFRFEHSFVRFGVERPRPQGERERGGG